MAKQFDDGGPAFPRAASEYTEHGTCQDGNTAVNEQDGMTLWDYFAAHALTGLLAAETAEYGYKKLEDATMTAASVADAMIAERKKRMG